MATNLSVPMKVNRRSKKRSCGLAAAPCDKALPYRSFVHSEGRRLSLLVEAQPRLQKIKNDGEAEPFRTVLRQSRVRLLQAGSFSNFHYLIKFLNRSSQMRDRDRAADD